MAGVEVEAMSILYFLLGLLVGVLVLRRYYLKQLERARRAHRILIRKIKREEKKQ